MQRGIASLEERTRVINAIIRVNRICFPAPGIYGRSERIPRGRHAERLTALHVGTTAMNSYSE